MAPMALSPSHPCHSCCPGLSQAGSQAGVSWPGERPPHALFSCDCVPGHAEPSEWEAVPGRVSVGHTHMPLRSYLAGSVFW